MDGGSEERPLLQQKLQASRADRKHDIYTPASVHIFFQARLSPYLPLDS